MKIERNFGMWKLNFHDDELFSVHQTEFLMPKLQQKLSCGRRSKFLMQTPFHLRYFRSVAKTFLPGATHLVSSPETKTGFHLFCVWRLSLKKRCSFFKLRQLLEHNWGHLKNCVSHETQNEFVHWLGHLVRYSFASLYILWMRSVFIICFMTLLWRSSWSLVQLLLKAAAVIFYQETIKFEAKVSKRQSFLSPSR